VYSECERYEEALEAYHKSIELDDTDFSPYMGLGWVYGKLDRRERAKEAFQQAIDVEPEDEQEGLPRSLIRVLVGNAYRTLGWYEEALEVFQAAARDTVASGLDYDYHYHLARTYEDLGDFARAREEFEKTVDLNPALWWCQPHLHYFLCLYRLDRKDEADSLIRVYSDSLRQSEWSPDPDAGRVPVVDFYAGDMPESLLTETLTGGKTWDTEAGRAVMHYYLGMAYLLNIGNISASGPDTALARQHFEACLATAEEEVEEVSCAEVELSRLAGSTDQ
jgi:tetratricopeptide (TPR) repeat protein